MKNFKIYLVVVLLLAVNLIAEDRSKVFNLSGYWKFSIGDNPDWKKTGFNDNNWEDIRVPAFWEDKGYHGYDGYAWYRKQFIISDKYLNTQLYVELGYVDDVDETYINGVLIGKSGSFPPDYITSYFSYRKYPIPMGLLKPGNNVIAVRVYDDEQGGGIVNGEPGIYSYKSLSFNIGLEGYWKFKPGFNDDYKNVNFDDSKWDEILVPGFWENQGYKDYDGYAWYRKKFKVSKSIAGQKLVLVMGKIDDYDQVYINGKLVGSTGKMNNIDNNNLGVNYAKFRGYYLPDNLLNYDGENVIAVKVYDGYKDGGIYEGPIGITTQKNYVDYWKKKEKRSFWDRLFNN
ncbi:MAG TPA: beta galactosidase jelly roll domain-containing protein [Melioribacteraceae bacterium]|nr:beta galactosidase jelly roll domain-containing protein [Melioribacteraceae bacterium]